MEETRTPSKRRPVACEPCRTRKIRCLRDGVPCSTCIRRGILHCTYSNHRLQDPPSNGSERVTQAAPQAPIASSAVDPVAQLSGRVDRLERLLEDRGGTCRHLDLPHHAASQITPLSPLTSISHSEYPWKRKHFQGTLQRTDTGYVRFVAKSQQWSHDQDHDGYALSFSPEPPLSTQHISSKDLLLRLPPTTQCTELVNVYFRSFASLFHILHDPTFASQYDSFLEDAEAMPLAWLALLFAVLGTAVLALDRDSSILNDLSRSRRGGGNVKHLMEQYRSAAMVCLEADNYLWKHNVTTLQALILLIYGIGHSHGRTWTLLGLTHHLAVSLGCHVDPTEFGLGPREAEERRRCWSGLMMLYTSENLAIGNSGLPHHMLASNCRPPADINDDEVESIVNQTSFPITATQMTYILLKFRMYDICARLCDHVLDPKQPPSYTMVKELDAAIEHEQQSCNSRYLNDNAASAHQLPAHHLAHLNILNSYANHLFLLLHRAALVSYRDRRMTESSWSEERLVTSALRLLEIHGEFHRFDDLAPFRWYNRGLGSFHAFHAATVLFSLRRCETGRTRVNEVESALKDCTTRFEALQEEAVSELSPLFSKATPVLHSLCSLLSSERGHSDRIDTNATFSERSRGAAPATQPQSAYAISSLLATPDNSIDGIWTLEQQLEGTLEQFQPQHWLTPSCLPWNVWDTWTANAVPITSV